MSNSATSLNRAASGSRLQGENKWQKLVKRARQLPFQVIQPAKQNKQGQGFLWLYVAKA